MIPNPSVRESPKIKILKEDSGKVCSAGVEDLFSLFGFEHPHKYIIKKIMDAVLDKREFVILTSR